MIISNNFNRLFWGTIITDIKVNLKTPIELNHEFFGHIRVDLTKLSKNSIHQLLKQLTNFPKDENYKAKSLKEVTNKDLVNHIELIKVMMSQNGFTFTCDSLEWERLLNEARNYKIKE